MKMHSRPFSAGSMRILSSAFRRGWTLIELIAVLSVMALLLAMVTPALLTELERQARNVEVRRLEEMTMALRQEVRRTGSIPDAAGLSAWLAPALGWRTAEVLTNARGLARRVVFHPDWETGPATNRTLPYQQTSSGGAAPAQARLLLLSSLGEPIDDTLSAESGLSAEDFTALWQTEPGSLPPGWTWPGRADELLISRVDLEPEFVPVTFHSRDPDAPQIATSTQAAWVLPNGLRTGWYLVGTPLRLMDSAGTVQSVETVQAAASWVFDDGKWRRAGAWNGLPEAPSGRDFAELAARFLRSPANPHGPAGAQDRVRVALSLFTAEYEAWAASGQAHPLTDDAPLRLAHGELLASAAALLTPP